MSSLAAAWNPWRALRELDHVRLWFAPLDGLRGLWLRDEHGDLIVLDPELDRRTRRCVLAHELVHAERGVGHGAASAATMEREEEIVRREVARRLVPPVALARFVTAHEGVGPVSVHDVSEEFDVDANVASKALQLLSMNRFSRESAK